MMKKIPNVKNHLIYGGAISCRKAILGGFVTGILSGADAGGTIGALAGPQGFISGVILGGTIGSISGALVGASQYC